MYKSYQQSSQILGRCIEQGLRTPFQIRRLHLVRRAKDLAFSDTKGLWIYSQQAISQSGSRFSQKDGPSATKQAYMLSSLMQKACLSTTSMYFPRGSIGPVYPTLAALPVKRMSFGTFTRGLHSTGRRYTPMPSPGSSHDANKDTEGTKSKHITKQTLLAQASGRMARLLVHIKWPLQRNNKPFSIDDLSALFSWVVMGNVLWILLGTTTFGLVLLYSLHTFDTVRGKVLAYFGFDNDNDTEGDGNNSKGKKYLKDDSIVVYLTNAILSHGLGVRFEFSKGSVLPEFKDSKLTFHNIRVVSEKEAPREFDCEVNTLSVSLSFSKWSDGQGLVQDLEVSGCKGRIMKESQTAVSTVPPSVESNGPVFSRYMDSGQFQFDINDQAVETRSIPITMDPKYVLGSVKVRDSYFEVFEPNSDLEPIKISIFNCELPKLTGNTILIDFFNADSVTGSINGSMFTIHRRHYGATDNTIRFKLDGIDLAGLSSKSRQSKFNWIMNGKAEIEADIRFPSSQEEDSLFKLEYNTIAEMVSRLLTDSSTDTEITDDENFNDNTLMKGALHAMYETFEKEEDSSSNGPLDDYVFITAKVKFSHLQATLPKELPMSSGSIPFLTLHDLRSLVTYINKQDTESTPPYIVKTMAIEKLSGLRNIGRLSQAKVFDVLVSEIYDEFMKMVKMDEQRIIHEKSSLWSHSLASQLLLLGLGVIV